MSLKWLLFVQATTLVFSSRMRRVAHQPIRRAGCDGGDIPDRLSSTLSDWVGDRQAAHQPGKALLQAVAWHSKVMWGGYTHQQVDGQKQEIPRHRSHHRFHSKAMGGGYTWCSDVTDSRWDRHIYTAAAVETCFTATLHLSQTLDANHVLPLRRTFSLPGVPAPLQSRGRYWTGSRPPPLASEEQKTQKRANNRRHRVWKQHGERRMYQIHPGLECLNAMSSS